VGWTFTVLGRWGQTHDLINRVKFAIDRCSAFWATGAHYGWRGFSLTLMIWPLTTLLHTNVLQCDDEKPHSV